MKLDVGVIDPQDLPEPWAPDTPDDATAAGLEQLIAGDVPDGELGASWQLIRNGDTNERAWLRLQRTPELGTAVTALVFLPAEPGQRISNRTLRSIPLAGIELSIDSGRANRRLSLARRLFGKDWDPAAPLGSPRDDEHFYERVAQQFASLKDSGEPRPVARMVEINARPAKTVQGWVTEARRLGFLPPGRQGKAG